MSAVDRRYRHPPADRERTERIRSLVMMLEYAERESRELSAVAALHVSRAVEELTQVHFEESFDVTPS